MLLIRGGWPAHVSRRQPAALKVVPYGAGVIPCGLLVVARRFRDLVSGRGRRWPPSWIMGRGSSSRTGPCAPLKICSPLALASTSGCSRICPGVHGRTTNLSLRDGVTRRRPWPPPFMGCSSRSSRLPLPLIRPRATRAPATRDCRKGDEGAGAWPEKSRRTLVLAPDQVRLFRRACRGKQPQDLIFTAPGGGAWYSGCFFAHRWRPVLDTANAVGLTGRSRVHDLCRTHASWLIARTVPLPGVQGRLGHESITASAERRALLEESRDRCHQNVGLAPLQGDRSPPPSRSAQGPHAEREVGRGARRHSGTGGGALGPERQEADRQRGVPESGQGQGRDHPGRTRR